MKSLPRYLLIVFALAGDSTITRFLAITKSIPARTDEVWVAEGCLTCRFPRVLSAVENALGSAVASNRARKAAQKPSVSEFTSQLPHEAFTGERADQFAHFQGQQRAGQWGNRELRRVRELVDLLRCIRRQQLEYRSFVF